MYARIGTGRERVRLLEQHALALRPCSTGAPVPSARSATPSRWSQWPCVIRIAAQRAPISASREPDRRRVAARVDDDRLRRAALGPDEVAVRPDRAERELFDDGRHGCRV